jgi:hypothetical protein
MRVTRVELFFSCYVRGDFCEAPEVNEPVDLVALGEAVFEFSLSVLLNSNFNLCGDAYVELLETAGKDVDVGLLLHSGIIADR